jgi:hypothetical protein
MLCDFLRRFFDFKSSKKEWFLSKDQFNGGCVWVNKEFNHGVIYCKVSDILFYENKNDINRVKEYCKKHNIKEYKLNSQTFERYEEEIWIMRRSKGIVTRDE